MWDLNRGHPGSQATATPNYQMQFAMFGFSGSHLKRKETYNYQIVENEQKAWSFYIGKYFYFTIDKLLFKPVFDG